MFTHDFKYEHKLSARRENKIQRLEKFVLCVVLLCVDVVHEDVNSNKLNAGSVAKAAAGEKKPQTLRKERPREIDDQLFWRLDSISAHSENALSSARHNTPPKDKLL